MAIKIRCSECRKKVSIDEAFAGGMCRCPYCKALVFVPEESGQFPAGTRPAAPQSRPDAPSPGRPAAPGTPPPPPPPPGAPLAAEQDHEHIPMARPVKIQGIITIVLLALLVLMVAGGITAAVHLLPDGPQPKPGDDPNDYVPPEGPLVVTVQKAGVSDIAFAKGPVIYCIDAGSSMRTTFDGAHAMVRTSVESLKKSDLRFTILLCGEEEDKFMSPEYVDGGEKGSGAAKEFLELIQPGGASDISRSLKAALARKPGTIVLVSSKPVDEAIGVAEEARQQGVVIHAIHIWGDFEDPDTAASMKKLAEAADGQSRSHSIGEF